MQRRGVFTLCALREQCPVLREPHEDVVMVTGYEEAIAEYKEALRLQPGLTDARDNLEAVERLLASRANP